MAAAILFLAYVVACVIHTNEAYSAIHGSTSCPTIHIAPCGYTTLPNGDAVAMVPKLLPQRTIWMIRDRLQLQNVKHLICSKPACPSDPCRNGGTCVETIDGFSCDCTTAFHGQTCACPVQYETPDDADLYTFVDPALTLAPGRTSFEFNVIAKNNAVIGLSTVNEASGVIYKIGFGVRANTATIVRSEPPGNGGDGRHDGRLLLTESWNSFGVSFDHNGHFELYRVGDDADRIEWTDIDPTPLLPEDAAIYVGLRTSWGSTGIWRFPSSLCSA